MRHGASYKEIKMSSSTGKKSSSVANLMVVVGVLFLLVVIAVIFLMPVKDEYSSTKKIVDHEGNTYFVKTGLRSSSFYSEVVRDQLKYELVDSTKAQIEVDNVFVISKDAEFSAPKSRFCGRINAVNRVGAYSGWKFFVLESGVLFTSDPSERILYDHYNKLCPDVMRAFMDTLLKETASISEK